MHHNVKNYTQYGFNPKNSIENEYNEHRFPVNEARRPVLPGSWCYAQVFIN